MGSFDGWTRGVELNAEDNMDAGFSLFTTVITLKPGEYQVKLQVDGEWRLCMDWPTMDDGSGNTVNVLTVQ